MCMVSVGGGFETCMGVALKELNEGGFMLSCETFVGDGKGKQGLSMVEVGAMCFGALGQIVGFSDIDGQVMCLSGNVGIDPGGREGGRGWVVMRRNGEHTGCVEGAVRRHVDGEVVWRG